MRRFILVVALLCSCASIRDSQSHPHPTKEAPLPFCSIACGPGGRMLFGHQHICSGGASVWFTDFWAIGEYTERAADGTVTRDVWTSREGDYDKANVETMRCSVYIDQRIASRAVEQRGVRPGETAQGLPDHP